MRRCEACYTVNVYTASFCKTCGVQLPELQDVAFTQDEAFTQLEGLEQAALYGGNEELQRAVDPVLAQLVEPSFGEGQEEINVAQQKPVSSTEHVASFLDQVDIMYQDARGSSNLFAAPSNLGQQGTIATEQPMHEPQASTKLMPVVALSAQNPLNRPSFSDETLQRSAPRKSGQSGILHASAYGLGLHLAQDDKTIPGSPLELDESGLDQLDTSLLASSSFPSELVSLGGDDETVQLNDSSNAEVESLAFEQDRALKPRSGFEMPFEELNKNQFVSMKPRSSLSFIMIGAAVALGAFLLLLGYYLFFASASNDRVEPRLGLGQSVTLPSEQKQRFKKSPKEQALQKKFIEAQKSILARRWNKAERLLKEVMAKTEQGQFGQQAKLQLAVVIREREADKHLLSAEEALGKKNYGLAYAELFEIKANSIVAPRARELRKKIATIYLKPQLVKAIKLRKAKNIWGALKLYKKMLREAPKDRYLYKKYRRFSRFVRKKCQKSCQKRFRSRRKKRIRKECYRRCRRNILSARKVIASAKTLATLRAGAASFSLQKEQAKSEKASLSTEEPKTEEPKTEEPKTEEPKTEEPKTEKEQLEKAVSPRKKPKAKEPKTEKEQSEKVVSPREKPEAEEPKTEKEQSEKAVSPREKPKTEKASQPKMIVKKKEPLKRKKPSKNRTKPARRLPKGRLDVVLCRKECGSLQNHFNACYKKVKVRYAGKCARGCRGKRRIKRRSCKSRCLGRFSRAKCHRSFKSLKKCRVRICHW